MPRNSRPATESDDETPEQKFARRGDDFKSPKAIERNERRSQAVARKLAKKSAGGKVVEVEKGKFVEFALERNDRVFVILVEYGNNYGVALPPTAPLSTNAGPLHNAIPQPDRSTNNNTIWQADYNRAHFQNMYFSRMVEYYRTQSSGRYTINGDVTEWVRVPFNGSRYGANQMGDAAAWTLIADAINTWTKAQLDSGKTLAEIKQYLQTFDVWDRYDYNNNGNFDEPDGYIDHFQIVHSGAGEETGGGALGADAIWSHRWQVWYNRAGITGPSYNRDGGVEFGGGWGANPTGAVVGSSGASVGISTVPSTATRATLMDVYPVTPTGIWVGDYTIQPENGGLGVFAHEYGHDLGLPDHYDTNGGSNSTGFWTIMSSGSYLGDGTTDIGSTPGDFNGWDKVQLGWLTYDEATYGKFSVHKLGPFEGTTKDPQAIIIALPPSQNFKYDYDPVAVSAANGNVWWGGLGNSRDVTMIRQLDVPAGTSALTLRMAYNLDTGWDYAYVSVSTNNGATWTNLASAGTTTTSNPNGWNLGNGITGSTNGAWRNVSFNMTPYAGNTVLVRVRYRTDTADHFWGIVVDDIKLGSFTDTADASAGWTINGFAQSTGTQITNAPHFYIAEFRQYRRYDSGLLTGPYTFGYSLLPNWVKHYPYQDGLLITYADFDQGNNNTSLHRGEGFALPVDAHPEPLRRVVPYDGVMWTFSPWSSPIQSYDSTFGLEPTDSIMMPFVGILPPAAGSPAGTPNRVVQFEVNIPSLPGNPLFNDMNSYWSAAKPDASVIVPKTGTTFRVVASSTIDSVMHVHVNSN